ncbi:ThuA domain-containing protein [Catalinimonas sp. 4WD22]|uniref:ThuA domain-containing protein n=1 Tax=Catalinimonas locisalis TaxID=3133978 RepID=UPI003101815B
MFKTILHLGQLIVLMVIIIFLLNLKNTAKGQHKAHVLFITGQGNKSADHPYHSWKHDFPNHLLTLVNQDIADFTVVEDLTEIEQFTHYDLIINNGLFQSPGKQQFEDFLQAIKDGVPYLALHAGLVQFSDDPRYQQLIGAQYIHHDEIKTFTVQPYDAWYGWEQAGRKRHPITRGIDEFTILDELYLMQPITDKIEVLARAELHPIMWVRPWGRGKVLVLTLGHDAYSQQNPGFQSLFRNALLWLTDRPVQ